MLRFIHLNPILLPPSLLLSSISLRNEQCFPILFTSFTTCSICAFTCYPPSPASFSSGFFSFDLLLFLPFRLHHQYQSPHSCIPFSYIFSPQTIILDRLSPLFLAVFRFYLFFSFSVTDTLSLFLLPYLCRSFILFHSHLLDVYHFNYSFLQFVFFYSNFSCLKGFHMTFIFIYYS